MTTPKLKRKIRRLLSAEKPAVWIGKNGISREVLDEIDTQLERSQMVKVRILKTAFPARATHDLNSKVVAEKVVQQTHSVLVEVRGKTFILYRRKKIYPKRDEHSEENGSATTP